LCTIGTAFDDDAFLFEVKWDGVRALAYVDDRGLRVHSRNRRDLAGRYPELQALTALPPGTLVDGELAVLQPHGTPHFPVVVARERGAARPGGRAAAPGDLRRVRPALRGGRAAARTAAAHATRAARGAHRPARQRPHHQERRRRRARAAILRRGARARARGHGRQAARLALPPRRAVAALAEDQ